MMLEQHMPTEIGTVPVVAAYLAYIFVMVVINIFFTTMVINMHLRDPKQGKVPGWMRWIFLTKLNKLVCLNAEPYTALPVDLIVEETSAERELSDMRNGSNSGVSPVGEKSALEQTMNDIRSYLRLLAVRSTSGIQQSHQELVTQEWQQVARVIDRLLFISFLILTIIISIAMYAHY